MVAGPLFSTYSKNPEVPFDNAARLARRDALERSLAAELDQAQPGSRRGRERPTAALAAIAAAAI